MAGVQDMMQSLTNDQDLIQAGLFHSIYGTEGFQDFTVPLTERPKIKNIISDRAEYLCYGESICGLGLASPLFPLFKAVEEPHLKECL